MSMSKALRKIWRNKKILGVSFGVASIFFAAGIIFWGGFNTAMEATNTLTFCTSCHEMKDNVYQEYKTTIHYNNASGVRASCSDCHVPDPWVYKFVRKIKASRELFHWALGTMDTPEKFDAHRLEMAKSVWSSMKGTDSRECRNCHDFNTMQPETQKPRARKQHLNAMQNGNTCIDCHMGIAHKKVHDQLEDEELEQLIAPHPKHKHPVPAHWTAFFEKETAEKLAAQEAAEKAAQEAALNAAEEVEKAAESTPVKTAAPAKKAVPAGSSVNWSKSTARTINIFYPGQASIEWILRGKDHGGARPFKAGDRCVDCHDEETSAMGDLIVSGEKAEPTPIPGKRGSIPVEVRATYDSNNVYFQFQWADAAHTPVPFVDGGKMDPKNPMKLAIMLSDDNVEYADRGGCWGTCHADLNSMPFAPTGQDVTKYLTESRTKIETRGRKGAPLGGWDKRKTDDEIAAEFDAGHFMDLMRYRSGENKSESGYILADRVFEGDSAASFNAQLKSGVWTVEMTRPLKPAGKGNIALDTGKVYNFGFAIHDDYSNARFHHVSLGYRLGFDNGEVEINAMRQ